MVLTFNNDQFRILCICLHESLAARHRHYGVLAAMHKYDHRAFIRVFIEVIRNSQFHCKSALRAMYLVLFREYRERQCQKYEKCQNSFHCLISFISRHPECLPGYKSAAWVAVVGKGNLPDKREDLMLYTRLVFLVAVKTVREDFLFIPDSFGNHWNIPEHDDE